MQGETLHTFFGALAVQRDEDVAMPHAVRTLERLITGMSKDHYITELQDVLGAFNGQCHTPMKWRIAVQALRAGIIKASGYEEDERMVEGRPSRMLDRDFPQAIALARFWRGQCSPEREPEEWEEADRVLASLSLRQSMWRPRTH